MSTAQGRGINTLSTFLLQVRGNLRATRQQIGNGRKADTPYLRHAAFIPEQGHKNSPHDKAGERTPGTAHFIQSGALSVFLLCQATKRIADDRISGSFAINRIPESRLINRQ